MSKPIPLMPVIYPPKDGEVAQLHSAYNGMWADGFMPFLREPKSEIIKRETDQYLLLSLAKLRQALVRIKANKPEDRPKLEATYQGLFYMASRGYRARQCGGRYDAIALFKPGADIRDIPYVTVQLDLEKPENYQGKILPTSGGGLTKK